MTDSNEQLEARLARVESQVRALQDRLGEFTATERSKKQRALVIRLILLAVLLGAFFVLQSMKGGFQ